MLCWGGGPICNNDNDNKDHKDHSDLLLCVEFLRALGSQSGVSVWQHTLVG